MSVGGEEIRCWRGVFLEAILWATLGALAAIMDIPGWCSNLWDLLGFHFSIQFTGGRSPELTLEFSDSRLYM